MSTIEKEIAQKIKQLCQQTSDKGLFDKTYAGIITEVHQSENMVKVKYNNKESMFKVNNAQWYIVNDIVKIYVPNNNENNAYICSDNSIKQVSYNNGESLQLYDNTDFVYNPSLSVCIPSDIKIFKSKKENQSASVYMAVPANSGKSVFISTNGSPVWIKDERMAPGIILKENTFCVAHFTYKYGKVLVTIDVYHKP